MSRVRYRGVVTATDDKMLLGGVERQEKVFGTWADAKRWAERTEDANVAAGRDCDHVVYDILLPKGGDARMND